MNQPKKFRRLKQVLALILVVVFISGCATTRIPTLSGGYALPERERMWNVQEPCPYMFNEEYCECPFLIPLNRAWAMQFAGNPLQPMMERGGLRLYFDHETAGVGVRDLATGQLFRSSPEGAADPTVPVAITRVRDEIRSPLSITFHDNLARRMSTINPQRESIPRDQVNYQNLYCATTGVQVGIRTNMIIGRADPRFLVPRQMLTTYMEENIIQHIRDAEPIRDRFGVAIDPLCPVLGYGFYRYRVRYHYIERDPAEWEDSWREQMFALYPALEIAFRRGDSLRTLITGYTMPILREVETLIISAGYTFEQMEAHYMMLGVDPTDVLFPSFRISIDYILNEDGTFSVEIDRDNIIYERQFFVLASVRLLPFFAAVADQTPGYAFLPDGSGTLIYHNNERQKRSMISTMRVYGPNFTVFQPFIAAMRRQARMPVFGITDETANAAVFAVIEGGDAIANVHSEVAGFQHPFNTVYASFVLSEQQTAPHAPGQATFDRFEDPGFQGVISVRYFFLFGDDANHMGMARTYQQYLVERDILTPITPGNDVPFFVDTLAAVLMPRPILGFLPAWRPEPITHVDDAMAMMRAFYEEGVRNMTMRYHFWHGRATIEFGNHAPIRMDVVSEIGGERGLRRLQDYAGTMGFGLTLDVDFAYATGQTRGFDRSRDVSRSLFQQLQTRNEICPVREMRMWTQQIISPVQQARIYDRFMRDFMRMGINSISMSSMGEALNSDFGNHSYINRQDAILVTQSILRDASQQLDMVVVEGGNFFVLPYVDVILHMANSDSAFNQSDRSVPFKQAVLSGFMHYAGDPINLSGNWQREMLRAIEFGEIPFFKLISDDGGLLMDLGVAWTETFAINFDHWFETAVYIYHTINAVHRPLQGVPMTNNEIMAPGVHMSTFANGTRILVNYNAHDAVIGSTLVPARDFVVLTGNQRP